MMIREKNREQEQNMFLTSGYYYNDIELVVNTKQKLNCTHFKALRLL